ncbi:MAG: Mut7-C RNAse domain-containing protein [Nitrososphaerales archaeon]
MRFLVDSMHGSLARKLRLYGYDVSYNTNLDDKALISKAAEEDRWLLTSDRNLYLTALKRGVKACLLLGKDDASRAAEVFKKIGLEPPTLKPETSRCPICNGLLQICSPEEVEVKHKPKSTYYKCVVCGKLYWIGSHWPRIVGFDRRLRQLLKT